MSYNSDLQGNNAELQDILNTVNELPERGGDADLSNYYTKEQTEEYVEEYAQPKGDYALKREIPSVPENVSTFNNDAGYINESQLTDAVEDALADAKTSGEFDGKDGKTAYEYALSHGYTGNEADFAEKMAREVPEITQNTGDDTDKVMSQAAVTAALENLITLPYGGSKDWLEDNGDITQLYQIDGYIWAYIDSTGWTRSGTQYLVVSSKSEMTNDGGTPYLLRSGNSGTVYAYTPASGDSDVTLADAVPDTANDGDVITLIPPEVSSTSEMTDTSIQYAMGGKVWEYGQTEVEKEPENVFVPSKAQLNKRISSGGLSNQNGGYVTDYLEFDFSTAKSFKVWLPLDYDPIKENRGNFNYRVEYNDGDKTKLFAKYGETMSTKGDQVYIGQENGRYYFDISKNGNNELLSGISASSTITSTKYIRLGLGTSKGATSITVSDLANVDIRFEKDRKTVIEGAWVETEYSVGRKYQATVSGSNVTWSDIGTYVEPKEASWDATAETQNIIDSLSATANSGDTAVYSVDGYLYSYLNGASWMQTSKYSAPTLSIDGQLSLTSTNAIQNKVVASAIDAVQARANSNLNEINAINAKIAKIEVGSDEVVVPDFWKDAVDEVIAKIKALQVGRNCVTFPFFSDNHQRNGYAGILISHIMKECHIPYCFFGGDSISNGQIADEATMIAQDKAFDAMMSYVPNGRFCRAVGNHDGYWYDGTNKYYYNRDQIYDLFLREESIAQNKHFGEDGTYYYVDDIASKVRFIVMNTNNAPVDATQIAWVQNTALNITESGWGVVFISHQPISNHYHAGITNAADVVSAVTSTATSKSIPIIGWFSGHVHRDIMSTKRLTGGNGSNAGTEAGDLGFTQVIITSDHTGIAYDDATKHTVANDDQSHAIDFVTINKSTRTVNITRLGIGNDRSYTY